MADIRTQLDKIPATSQGYLRIPFTFAARTNGMTGAQLKIYASVFSRSCLINDPDAVCHASYSDYQDLLNIRSRSTVAAALAKLKEQNLIRQTKRYHADSEYIAIDPVLTEKALLGDPAAEPVKADPHAKAIELELFLSNIKFNIPCEARTRELRFVEALALALIATHTKNPETKGFTGSVEQIANICGVCEKTARAALRVLISAKLIFCRERLHRRSYRQTLHIVARKQLVIAMSHKKRANTPRKPVEPRSRQEIAADERAARDRYFAQRRQFAETMANHYRAQLERDKRYIELDRGIRSLDPQIARAELAEGRGEKVPIPSEELKKRQTLLRAQQLTIMEEIGISPPMLEASTYARCQKCHDTGFLPDGRACDCYKTSKEDDNK